MILLWEHMSKGELFDTGFPTTVFSAFEDGD